MKKLLILLLTILLVLSGCAEKTAVSGAGRSDVGPLPPESAAAVTEPAPPEKKDTVSIVMVGDVLLHTPISQSGEMEDGSWNYDHLFANVKDAVEAADLALVNEEVILGGREMGLSGYPRFNGAFEVADAEVKAGFDVILQATNHALDMGKEGLLNDLGYFRSNYPDISVTGIYDSAAARDAVCVREVNGVKIAVLNYTYSTNGNAMPDGMPWAVAMLDESSVKADFEKAKAAADFIIVCPHWGTEYSHDVSRYQRGWAEYFAELGADLVLGAHPHVIEPVEELTRPDGKTMPVFWSVGNFINSTAATGDGVAERMVGAMASVTLHVSDDGNVSVESYEAIPLVTHMVFGSGAPTTYFLSDYTEALAAESEAGRRDPDFSLEFIRALCESVLGRAWKR